MDNRFGGDVEDPLDPKRKIFNALAGPGDDDPIQPIDPTPKVELPPVGGSPAAAPSAGAPARTWSAGAKAGKIDGTLLGYDSGKLDNTGYSTGKYNPEVRAFDDGLKQDVGVSRGGLGNMLAYLQQEKGYRDATLVGDDKIDFDGPNGPLPPIDTIREDGEIVFQDPRGAAPGGGGTGGGMPGPVNASGGGSPLDGLLSGGDPMEKIKAAIAQLSGPRTSAQALLEALR